MVHLYTGDGKGKTTAAIGLAVRFAGTGKGVVFAQFMKGSYTSEINIIKNIENMEIMRLERDYGFYFQMSPEEKRAVRECHNKNLTAVLEGIKRGKFEMAVLDEICGALECGLADTEIIKEILKTDAEIVLTGRNPDKIFTDAADYISEIKCIRHPYERGVSAREGIEY